MPPPSSYPGEVHGGDGIGQARYCGQYDATDHDIRHMEVVAQG